MYYEIYNVKFFYVSILLYVVFIVVVNFFLNDVVYLFKFFVIKFLIRKWIIFNFVVCFLVGINWICGLF